MVFYELSLSVSPTENNKVQIKKHKIIIKKYLTQAGRQMRFHSMESLMTRYYIHVEKVL